MLYAFSVVTWPSWKDIKKFTFLTEGPFPSTSNVLDGKDLSLGKNDHVIKNRICYLESSREKARFSHMNICSEANTAGGGKTHMLVFLVMLFVTVILPFFLTHPQGRRNPVFALAFKKLSDNIAAEASSFQRPSDSGAVSYFELFCAGILTLGSWAEKFIRCRI